MGKAASHNTNIFKLFFRGFMIYLKNFIPLSKVMLFPVFGQIIGIILILYPAFLFAKNIPKMLSTDIISNNIILICLAIILITLPGFFVFTKAFWEYMVSMVSLNSMVSNIVKQGNIKDTVVHTQVTKLKSKEYIILLFILMLIWIVGLSLPALAFLFKNPFQIEAAPISFGFIILELASIFILTIASIYLSLCFQVFAFENIPTMKVLKRSWELVEGNFWRTFILCGILFLITGVLIPAILQTVLEKTALVSLVTYPFNVYLTNLAGNQNNLVQISQLNNILGPGVTDPIFEISKTAALGSFGGIITAFMLPLGSACYTLLYFDNISKKNKSKKK